MAQGIAERLKLARIAAGFAKAAPFAEAAGVPQSTHALHESGDRVPRAENLKKYAQTAKVREAWLLTGEGPMRHSSETEVQLITIQVVASVEAGRWSAAVEWPIDQQYQISAFDDPRFSDMRRFGFLVHGNSMNEVFPPGTVLICVKFIELQRDPRHDEYVIVYRHRLSDDAYEATVKQFQIDADGRPWLRARSTEPELSHPVRIDGDDVAETICHALVTGYYRPV